MGISAARNIALKNICGNYLMFVDSDDELTKDAVRRMIDIAVKYNSGYVDSYEIVKYTKRNNKVCMFTESKVPKKHLVLGSIKENPKIISMYMYSKGKLIKRELIGDLIYDESLRVYEDVVFEQTLKSRVKNYVMMNKPVYFYYQREDSLINALGKKHTYFLESVKRVKLIYEDFDKNIKDIFNFDTKVDDKYYYTEGKYKGNIYKLLTEEMDDDNTVYQWRRKYVRKNQSNLVPTLTANMGEGRT